MGPTNDPDVFEFLIKMQEEVEARAAAQDRITDAERIALELERERQARALAVASKEAPRPRGASSARHTGQVISNARKPRGTAPEVTGLLSRLRADAAVLTITREDIAPLLLHDAYASLDQCRNDATARQKLERHVVGPAQIACHQASELLTMAAAGRRLRPAGNISIPIQAFRTGG